MEVRERVQEHRARMRARGLRSREIWVPDTRTPAFAREAAREAAAIAASSEERDDMAFLESITVPREE